MKKSKAQQRVWILFAAVLAVVFTLSAWLMLAPVIDMPTAYAATHVGDRVTPLDLMSVHQVDWVMGPLDVNADGSYKSTNKDSGGYPTNNVYGIPANKYFNINNYLYTTNLNGEKILRGWKNGIQKVITGDNGNPLVGAGITEQGYMETDPSRLGIYVDSAITASKNKYMLIMPDDITQIGSGSGAFDGATSTGTNTSGTASGNNFNDFTDFAFYIWSGEGKYTSFTSAHPNYWSPRERLAGVYFNNSSKLKSFTDRLDPNNGYRLNKSGKSAFAGCDNMKFFVLPENGSFTEIGDYAFGNCEQLRDFNIPTTVTRIGAGAFKNCANIVHLSIPEKVETLGPTSEEKPDKPFVGMANLADVENRSSVVNAGSFSDGTDKFTSSKLLNIYPSADGSSSADGSRLYVVGNDENDTGASGYYFCKNTRGYDGTLATVTNVTGGSEKYKKDNWYVVALAGKDDSTATVVRKFPKQVTTDDARRNSILYDYLDSAGKMCKNALSETITKYDIGNAMANNTWCSNAVLPTSVEIIGDKAFFYSHTQYLEMSATTVGSNAFGNNNDEIVGTQENYYIHKEITKYGNAVFGGGNSNSSVTRRFIFEDKALYDTYVEINSENVAVFKTGNVFDSNVMKSERRYQIPIVANVESADGAVNIIEGDIDDRFDYDADYEDHNSVTGADANGNGTYAITYTKRLSGEDFNTVKSRLGTWTVASSTDHANPTIECMVSKSTQWYTSNTYADKTTAAEMYSSSTTSVNIYTKKIAKPENIGDKSYDGKFAGKYTYGENEFGEGDDKVTVTLGEGETECVNFYDALGLSSDDYTVSLRRFTYADGMTTGVADVIRNAGTYELDIQLDSKWGVWSSDYLNDEKTKDYFTATVTVARKEIDYSDLSKIPQFLNASDNTALYGDNSPLFNYNDGWYTAQQIGKDLNDTKHVSNSYLFYTGSQVAIKMFGEEVSDDKNSSTLGVSNILRNSASATSSFDYSASFEFRIKTIPGTTQTNYIYYYGNNEATKYNNIIDEVTGVSMTGKQDTSFRIIKRWYIVIETNTFIVKGDEHETAYTPVAPDPEDPDKGIVYNDAIVAQVPALSKGDDDGAIEFEITFLPVGSATSKVIRSRTALGEGDKSIGYYINMAMPAGEYTVKLYGKGVEVDGKKYPEVAGVYAVVVAPREFDTETIETINETVKNVVNGEEVGNEYAVNGDKKLHGDVSALLGTLKANLQVVTDANNFWLQEEQADYFSADVAVSYSRAESTGNAYYSAADMLNILRDAGEYSFYYSIAAKNFKTIGGASVSDTERAHYSFKTTLYYEIKLFEDVYNEIIGNKGNFGNVVYTGADAYTNVPLSRYYSP